MDVTSEQLTKVLEGIEFAADVINADIPGTWVSAKPRYPGSLANAILAALDQPELDPELSAITRILCELGELSGVSGAGIASEIRALAYVASRYGYNFAPKDED